MAIATTKTGGRWSGPSLRYDSPGLSLCNFVRNELPRPQFQLVPNTCGQLQTRDSGRGFVHYDNSGHRAGKRPIAQLHHHLRSPAGRMESDARLGHAVLVHVQGQTTMSGIAILP